MTSVTRNSPPGYRHVPAEEWRELNQGDHVWIYDVAWGVGAGRVDDVSQHQELLWVVLEPTGRKLFCGSDDVEVWAA
ncbi:hypothetical protein AB0N65_18165 [Paenarthrobacter sp. NPDC089322]|uniref:hypothetical protein n=1 Tax=Paenarthrobacter sp. NPDC089322 TaxID=3155065 RepID=UPI00343D7BD0